MTGQATLSSKGQDPPDPNGTTSELIVLGSGNAYSVESNCASLILRTRASRLLLLDSGIGNAVIRQLRKLNLPLAALGGIFISHQHSDHAAGFITLMLHMERENHDFDVFCTPGVGAALRGATNLLLPGVLDRIGNRLRWCEIQHDHERKALDGEVLLKFLRVEHGVEAVGLTVEVDDYQFAYSGDTRPSEQFARSAHGVDMLVHEANDLAAEVGIAASRPESGHSTAADAGRVAAMMAVRRLVLTHIGDASEARRAQIAEEAEQKFLTGEVIVARDLMKFELGPPHRVSIDAVRRLALETADRP